MALASTLISAAEPGGPVPIAVIQLKRVPRTAFQRRVEAPLVALEHPEMMLGDLDLMSAINGIEADIVRGKGKYRKRGDPHRADLELPHLAGDSQDSWLATLGSDGAAEVGEDPRTAALRAILAEGLGQQFRPAAPQSDNTEFRTRTPMPDCAVPRALMTAEDVKPLPLDAFHGLIYSQIFDPTTVSDLKDILGSFGIERLLHALDELCLLGVVEVPVK
jgi:hypothetical protein